MYPEMEAAGAGPGGSALHGVCAGAGQLERWGLHALDRPEGQLRRFALDGCVLDVDDDRLTDAELLPQDALRQRVRRARLVG